MIINDIKYRGSEENWREVGYIFISLGFLSAIFFEINNDLDWIYHELFCILGLLYIFIFIYNISKSNLEIFFYDLRVIYLIAFSIYFLIGGLFVVYGAEEDIYKRLLEFQISPKSVLRVDALNSIGFGLTLLISGITKKTFMVNLIKSINIGNNVNIKFLIIIFIVLSFSFKFYFIYYHDSNTPISRLFAFIDQLSILAIFLSAYYSGRGQTSIRILGIITLIICALLGLSSFNKTAVILPILANIGGTILRNKFVSKYVILTLTLVTILYITLGGIVQAGREAIGTRTNNISFAERKNIIELATFDGIGQYFDSGSGWSRISYVTSQAAGMELYDNDQGGEDINNLLWLFVPRFLYPNKPNISSEGENLFYKIHGFDGESSTGQGIFGDSYYNGGWMLLVLYSIIIGSIIGQMKLASEYVYHNKILILYFIPLACIFMALRIDGSVLIDYIANYINLNLILIVILIIKKYFT